MEDKVKNYLMQKFDEGARSGLKVDPAQVSREMKFAKDANGVLCLVQRNGERHSRLPVFLKTFSNTMKNANRKRWVRRSQQRNS